MSRAPESQGARWQAIGMYRGVHEDFEPRRNAAMTHGVVFKIAFELF